MTLAPDPTFAGRYFNIPQHIARWADKCGGIEGKRLLEVGHGRGYCALGIAIQYGPALIRGIDVQTLHHGCLEQAKHHIDLDRLPDNLIFETVEPGSLGSNAQYDFIYSWSVFEHIQPDLFSPMLTELRYRLAPGGHLFFQIDPLYYSAQGAHLTPLGLEPWGHLLRSTEDLRDFVFSRSGFPSARLERLWQQYVTLNRFTEEKFLSLIADAGFSMMEFYKTYETLEPPASLLAAHDRSVLTTKQIVGLLKPIR